MITTDCKAVTAALWCTLLASFLMLSGCGFHLQAQTTLSPRMRLIYVEANDTQSDFFQALRRALRLAGAQLATGKDELGAVIIHIERDEMLERIASVSARNVPREYELAYLLRYSVDTAKNTLIPSEEVSVIRDFSFDERIVLAKEREREILQQTLAQELASVVLQRLVSVR